MDEYAARGTGGFASSVLLDTPNPTKPSTKDLVASLSESETPRPAVERYVTLTS